jgi:hypothetical protein
MREGTNEMHPPANCFGGELAIQTMQQPLLPQGLLLTVNYNQVPTAIGRCVKRK